MDLGKASRFSVLEDDYEGRHPKVNSSTTRANRTSSKNINLPGESNEKKSKQNRKNNDKASVASNRGVDTDLQSLAFCTGRQKKVNGQQQPAKSNKSFSSVLDEMATKTKTNQEFSERKNVIDEEEEERLRFEKDLEQAILLSKLDYDKSEDLVLHKNFKELPPNCGSSLNVSKESNRKMKPPAETCKCSVEVADLKAKIDILQSKDKEKNSKNLQLLEKLTESFEMTELLKAELNTLKSLSSTEICASLEKQIEEQLRENNELSEEISRLHVALEQERSKNHSLHMELLHMQNSRKDAK